MKKEDRDKIQRGTLLRCVKTGEIGEYTGENNPPWYGIKLSNGKYIKVLEPFVEVVDEENKNK